jgi:hypothetical protein
MPKERTPFTGCGVVCRRAAAKFPAAVAMADEPGCAKGSDEFASVRYQADERVRFRRAGEVQTSRISSAWLPGGTTWFEDGLKLEPTFEGGGYGSHNLILNLLIVLMFVVDPILGWVRRTSVQLMPRAAGADLDRGASRRWVRYIPSGGNSWKPSMANSEWGSEAGAPSSFRSSLCPQVHLNLLHRVKAASSVFVLFISAPQMGQTIDIVVAFMIGVHCTGRARA